MKPYWKITLAYLVFGVVWIALTDWACEQIARDARTLSDYQTFKGWLYVGVSSVLIFFLTRKAFQRQKAVEKEKLQIFRNTLRAVHHIFLNYLNQMQLVTMEAERAQDFDKDILKLSKDLSDNAVSELRKLSDVEVITPGNIDSVAYREVQ